jgi:hypothetical protein
VLAIWSAYIATWAWASGSGPVVVVAWWLAGVCVLQGIVSGRTGRDAQHPPKSG